MKFLFSLIVGSLFALVTALLVGIYWLIGLLARITGLIAMPFQQLFSSR